MTNNTLATKLQTLDPDGWTLLTAEAKQAIVYADQLLGRSADTLQGYADDGYNDALAMEIYTFLGIR